MLIAILIVFALVMAPLIYNIGTGRNPFADLENAAFLYSIHRRQYHRGRWASIVATWKEINERS